MMELKQTDAPIGPPSDYKPFFLTSPPLFPSSFPEHHQKIWRDLFYFSKLRHHFPRSPFLISVARHHDELDFPRCQKVSSHHPDDPAPASPYLFFFFSS